MTALDFTSQAITLWPYIGNKTDEERSVIREQLLSFAEGNLRYLDKTMNELQMLKPPNGFNMWWFYSKVKEYGGGQTENRVIWWRECDNGHKYRDTGSRCPLCESYYFKLHKGDSMPTEATLVQESCQGCPWFKAGESRLYGPSCNEYGTFDRMKDPICKDCRCRGCCEMEFTYRYDKEKYKAAYGSKITDKVVDFEKFVFDKSIRK